MNAFNIEHFARHLIAEALFYDEEYGAVGSLSLVDPEQARERFIASFLPDEGTFVVEEATAWENFTPGEDDAVGYALAVDSEEHATYDLPEEAAEALLLLAREHDLLPSVTLLFEDETL